MKLKFDIRRQYIKNLHQILTICTKIWKNDERIIFYFDDNQLIIYPETRQGFDKIFARIHIILIN